MKKKLGVLTATLLLISGCGGGGGESGTVSQTREVTATVESSLVRGALVCVKGTENCARTDENGIAHLEVNSLPVELEVRAGNLTLGEVRTSSDTVRINPIVLADGDIEVAGAIADLIHALGGDPEGNSPVVDLSEVEVESAPPESLEELLKEGKEVELKVKSDKEEHLLKVKKEDGAITVELDNVLCTAVNPEKLSLWKLATFLTAADGRKVSILSSKREEKVVCTLELNPQEPDQFKLKNCTDPDYNDENWEKVKSEDGKLLVEDEDGKTYEVSEINLEAFSVNLKGDGETVTVWLSDAPSIIPQMSQSELNEKLEKGRFDEVYSYLTAKENLTDQEKVALAVAVLGKAVKDNLLLPAGLSIISPETSPFFKVVETGNQAQLPAIEAGAQELLTQIDRAIKELDGVKEPRDVELPTASGINARTLDATSLKALKALLLYAKSNLDYLLAYDWSVYQNNLGEKYPSVLELASKLTLTSRADRYLEASKEELRESAELLSQAGSDILEKPPLPETLTYALVKPEQDGFLIGGKLWSTNNFETVVEDLKTLASNIGGTVTVRAPKAPSDPNSKINDHTVNTGAPFTSPLTGEEIQADVKNGNAIEVNLCTEWMDYTDEEGNPRYYCTRYERDVWITENSNIFRFLEKVYSDAENKFKEPIQYGGKTFYSLRGFFVNPEEGDFKVIYPQKQ